LAVVIRLKRGGAKKLPHYRIVVADSRKPRDGRVIEEIGHYDPVKGKECASVDRDRANYWIGEGARVTDTVRGIFKRLHV
jgi:small subunit ribosomal protein S16